MVGGTHIYGGFNLSPYLALRVFEAVKEITTQNLNVSLSHVDDDNCEICRSAQAKPLDSTLEARDKSLDNAQDKSLDIARDRDANHDAAQPGRPGREWAA